MSTVCLKHHRHSVGRVVWRPSYCALTYGTQQCNGTRFRRSVSQINWQKFRCKALRSERSIGLRSDLLVVKFHVSIKCGTRVHVNGDLLFLAYNFTALLQRIFKCDETQNTNLTPLKILSVSTWRLHYFGCDTSI